MPDNNVNFPAKVKVKICGIKTLEALNAAVKNQADYIGFVNFLPSPRNISKAELVKLSNIIKGKIKRVGVFVDPSLEDLSYYLDNDLFDVVQLHGSESISYVNKIKETFDVEVMKAISVGDILPSTDEWLEVADHLIFDCKSKQGDLLPGGLGRSFNWSLLEGINKSLSWCLAGGININNFAKAIKDSGANWLDVSSGVETSAGVKSPALIEEFLLKVKPFQSDNSNNQ